jgi:hypothetical protein
MLADTRVRSAAQAIRERCLAQRLDAGAADLVAELIG